MKIYEFFSKINQLSINMKKNVYFRGGKKWWKINQQVIKKDFPIKIHKEDKCKNSDKLEIIQSGRAKNSNKSWHK